MEELIREIINQVIIIIQQAWPILLILVVLALSLWPDKKEKVNKNKK